MTKAGLLMIIHKLYRLFFKHFRTKRMKSFEKYFDISQQTRIVDVGGAQFNWKLLNCTPEISIINLDQPNDWDNRIPNTRFEKGDGKNLRFEDQSFDIAYSNSVIEHLYDWESQKQFAKEITRIGKRIYLQSPAKEFFVEPHLITPFIHWLPKKWQSKLLRNFTIWGLMARPSQEYVDTFLREIRLLTFSEFKLLFPQCKIVKEKFFFLTK